jgi:hypothetical protein
LNAQVANGFALFFLEAFFDTQDRITYALAVVPAVAALCALLTIVCAPSAMYDKGEMSKTTADAAKSLRKSRQTKSSGGRGRMSSNADDMMSMDYASPLGSVEEDANIGMSSYNSAGELDT